MRKEHDMRRRLYQAVGFGALLAGLGVTLGVAPARAQQADNASIVTLDLENDAVAGTDRDYTSGIGANYVAPTGALPDWLARAGHVLYGNGTQRISLGVSQELFTPSDTQIDPPDPRDRPYAGELQGNFALIQDANDFRSVMEVDLGVIGPDALGRELQNGFHSLIGDTPNRGWSHQINNEPLGEIISDRTYRVSMGNIGPFETDVLPELSVGLGNERVYALTGAQVRIGQGLTSDFGASRLRPGLTGMDAYTPTQSFVWYVFAGLDGQAIAHDITINGNTTGPSPSTSLTPFVGEGQAGLAVMAYGVKLSYTEVVQSHEYREQPSGLFQFGVVTLSTRF